MEKQSINMNYQDEQYADYDAEERLYFLQKQYEEYISLSKQRRNRDIDLDLLDMRMDD